MSDKKLGNVNIELKKYIYKVISEATEAAVEKRNKEKDLPYLLTRKQLAQHIFNCTVQSLDSHILVQDDFPRFEMIGSKVLYPRDEVIDWIMSHSTSVKKIRSKSKTAVV